jgi:hypothetical protein
LDFSPSKDEIEPAREPSPRKPDPVSAKRIESLEQQLRDLKKLFTASQSSAKVIPESQKKGEEEEDDDDDENDDRPKFDHVTGKPLNAKAVAMRDDQHDEQPRFDVKTGEPKNHAAAITVNQTLIKQTVHELNFKDYHAEQFIGNSLCFFGRDHFVRVYCLRLAHWNLFDRFILLCIMGNAICMGMADYSNFDKETQTLMLVGWRNPLLHYTDLAFTIIFTVECMIKVIAMGLGPFGRNTYLSDHWNQLDFVVVVTGILEVIPGMPSLGGLRTFRVLRPLRAAQRFPELSILVHSLLRSLPGLLKVFTILLACLFVFGILSVQVFGSEGLTYGRCRLTPFPVKWKDGRSITLDDLDGAGASRLAQAYYEGDAEPCLGPASPPTGAVAGTWGGEAGLATTVLSADLWDVEWTYSSSPWNQRPANCAWPQVADEAGTVCNYKAGPKGGSGRLCGRALRSWLVEPMAEQYPEMAVQMANLADPATPWPTTYSTPEWYEGGRVFNTSHVELDWGGNPNETVVNRSTAYTHDMAWLKWCGSDLDNKGNARYADMLVAKSQIFIEDFNWGFTSFDNVPAAVLTLFQCSTLEGWTDIMYQVGDGVDKTFSVLFFLLLNLIAAMFIFNLILVIISESFNLSHDEMLENRAVDGFVQTFKLLDSDGNRYLTLPELRTTAEFSHLTVPELVEIVKEYDQNFDGKISQEEFVHLMLSIQSEEQSSYTLTRMGVANPEQMHKKIMCIDFNSAWCFHSFEWAKTIVEHPHFDPVVIVLILVNTGVLSFYKYPQDEGQLCVLDTIGFVLSLLFLMEMVLKLLGIGVYDYLNDGFNCVDGFIVLISLVELMMAPPACFTGTDPSGSGGAFSAMRTVRLFRIFKLMSTWKGLRRMVNVVIGMLAASVNLGALLLLFMYIFSILGMEFFATKLHFDDHGYALHWNDTAFAESESPRTNFDDFWSAFLTVFQILSGEDWNVVMYTARRGGGDEMAIVYFVLVLLFGNFILLNLFLAILLDGMEAEPDPDGEEEEAGEEDEEDEEEMKGRALKAAAKKFEDAGELSARAAKDNKQSVMTLASLETALATHAPSPSALSGDSSSKSRATKAEAAPGIDFDVPPEVDKSSLSYRLKHPNILSTVVMIMGFGEQDITQTIPEGKVFGLFSETHPFRVKMSKVVFHKSFDHLILLLIGAGAFMLALDNPLWDPDSAAKGAIKAIDVFMTSVFTLECLLKIIVYGFFHNKGAYLRTGWNQLDFIVVVISVLSLAAEGNSSLSSLRSLRALRALRPLRVISRYPGLKQVVNALFKSIPGVVHACVITMIAYLMFAIIAVSFFKGTFDGCQGADWEGDEDSGEGIALQDPAPFFNSSITMLEGLMSRDGMTAAAVAVLVEHWGGANGTMSWPVTEACVDDAYNASGIFTHTHTHDHAHAHSYAAAAHAHRQLHSRPPKRKRRGRINARRRSRKLTPKLRSTMAQLSIVGEEGAGGVAVDGEWLEPAGRRRLSAADEPECEGGYEVPTRGPLADAFPLLHELVVYPATYRQLHLAYLNKSGHSTEIDLKVWHELEQWVQPMMLCTAYDEGKQQYIKYENCTLGFNKEKTGNAVADWARSPTSRNVCQWLQQSWCESKAGWLIGDCPLDITWSNLNDFHFNNVASALLLLFEVCSTEGWVDVMLASIDARSESEMQPIENNNRAASLFYVVFLCVCSFFVMNLFIGVIIDKFNQEKRNHPDKPSMLVTKEQIAWMKAQKMAVHTNPIVLQIYKPSSQFGGIAWELASEEGMYALYLDNFIMVCILLNTILMATVFFGQPDTLTEVQSSINYLFGAIYIVEASVKLYGLHWGYFHDNWNVFDFTLVCATVTGWIVSVVTSGGNFAVIATVVRTFRVGRIVRLIRGSSSIRALFNTVILALPSLVNISALLLLIVFIYGVMGVQLFAKVKMPGNNGIDEHANFQTFSSAMLTLLRCSTGEFWNGLMYDLAIQHDCTPQEEIEWSDRICGMGPSSDAECIPIDGCGTSIAYPYFVSYELIITMVSIELFTAVIIEGYDDSKKQEATETVSNGIKHDDYQNFCDEWVHVCGGEGLHWAITEQQLEKVLRQLEPPLGFRGDHKSYFEMDEQVHIY